MMNPTIISLVRHADVHNPQNVFYGRLPRFGLSSVGVEQAQHTSEYLANKSLAAIFTSPLLRARQTAKIIQAKHYHLPLHVSRLLNEAHALFDGYPISIIAAKHWDVYTDAPSKYEQPQDIFARTQKFINRVRRKYLGRHIVAVTHGDTVAFMLLWSKGLPVTVQQRIKFQDLGFSDNYPAPASISTFTYISPAKNEIPQVDYINLNP